MDPVAVPQSEVVAPTGLPARSRETRRAVPADVVTTVVSTLVLEDSAADALFVERQLQRGCPAHRFAFELVETGADFELALDWQPWDLIIADFVLPGYDGLTALRATQTRGLDVPFIIVSGKMGEEAAVDAMLAGAHDYVLKSALSRLGPAVERELGAARVRRERAQAQAQLALQGVALAAAANSIIITGPSGEIEWVNDGFVSMTGYPREDVIGRSPGLLASGEPETELYRALRETITSGATWHGELVDRRSDGSLLTVRQTITPIRDERGEIQHFLAIQEDVTAERQMRDELAQRTVDLERSNQDLEEFAYIASHDLSAPLHVVGGYVELLRRRYGSQLDPDAVEFLDGAVRGVTRMQRLIDDLLDYSRAGRQEQTIEAVDSSEVAQDVLASLAGAIEAVDATVTVGPLPCVRADRTQLTQILQNLVGNALKFVADRPPEISIEAIDEGDGWRLSIFDNGPGIEDGREDEIFRMFGRLDATHEGSGIGLAVCKRLVERNGGRLSYAKRPEHGTVFHVTLPRAT